VLKNEKWVDSGNLVIKLALYMRRPQMQIMLMIARCSWNLTAIKSLTQS